MGQVSSTPAQQGEAKPPPNNKLQWHCANVEGTDVSNEISLQPSKRQIGLDNRRDKEFLPDDSGRRRDAPRPIMGRGPSDAHPVFHRGDRRREFDLDSLVSMSDAGRMSDFESFRSMDSQFTPRGSHREFTGPHSEGSFISGLSVRSSASSRGSPRGGNSATSGDIDEMDTNTAAMRAREQNDWDDTERDRDMYLRRIKAQVEQLPTPSRPHGAQDVLRPLPEPPQRRTPGLGSDAGNSDRTYDRHRGKQRGHGQRGLDTQSDRSFKSTHSAFSFSSFRSAISGVSERYSGRHRDDPRDPYDHSHDRRTASKNPSREHRDASRSTSRERHREGGGKSPRGPHQDREDKGGFHTPRESLSPRDNDRYDSRNAPRNNDRDRKPNSPHSHRDENRLAMRDRDGDDGSSGRGSRRSGSASGRRSLSRSGSVGADARGPGRGAVPRSKDGPEMRNWINNRSDGASSHGSERGSNLALERLGRDGRGLDDRAPDTVASSDLEAKLKNAQRNLAEVQSELEVYKLEQESLKSKKKKAMPGGNAVQHALMQDLRDLREYCMELDGIKEQEETQAKEAISKLQSEQQLRQEDIRARVDSEKLQAQLQSRIDGLTQEAKEHDSKLEVTHKDTEKMQELLKMIQSERDETLALLRRAVAQKEKMKGDRERESQESTDRFDQLEKNQKSADTKVRTLLNSVDTLLGKFSLDKEDPKSSGSARSTVKVQLELMKIRDSTRDLLKANESGPPRQTGGRTAVKDKR